MAPKAPSYGWRGKVFRGRAEGCARSPTTNRLGEQAPLASRRPLPEPAGEDLLALDLVEATPDAVGLADADGELQARLLHGADLADGLGPGLTGFLLVLALEVRRGEE